MRLIVEKGSFIASLTPAFWRLMPTLSLLFPPRIFFSTS